MLEIPEAAVLAKQINETICNKKIRDVIVMSSPHKFAWLNVDAGKYSEMLYGKNIGKAVNFGGQIEIEVDDVYLLFSDGTNIRFHQGKDTIPRKHQLLIKFEDHSFLSCAIQMYGGIWCFGKGEFDNIYYIQAKQKPSPLTDEFSKAYFSDLISNKKNDKLSLKAFLATDQRIPGLGNGVLQDILYNASLHPKKKINILTDRQIEVLFGSIKTTLLEITEKGGRDTEKDLFGQPGGYQTKLSKNTVGKVCDICGDVIKKEAYMGGSIYYCDTCQER